MLHSCVARAGRCRLVLCCCNNGGYFSMIRWYSCERRRARCTVWACEQHVRRGGGSAFAPARRCVGDLPRLHCRPRHMNYAPTTQDRPSHHRSTHFGTELPALGALPPIRSRRAAHQMWATSAQLTRPADAQQLCPDRTSLGVHARRRIRPARLRARNGPNMGPRHMFEGKRFVNGADSDIATPAHQGTR